MTAPVFDPSSQRYQRLLSKAGAMSAEQRGLLGVLLDKGAQDVATLDMKNYIALAELGAKKEQTDRYVALGEKKLSTMYGPDGLLTRELDLKNDIALKGLKSKEGISERSLAQGRELGMAEIGHRADLREAELDYKKDQLLPSALIGGAGVIVSGMQGLADLEESEKKVQILNAQKEEVEQRRRKARSVVGLGGE